MAMEHLRSRIAKAQEENQRLVFVESDFSANKWVWLEEGSGVVEESAWNTSAPTDLLAWDSIPK